MEVGDSIMNKVKLIVHIRDGAFWDVSNMIPSVKISGSTSSVARTLETEVFQTINDKQIKQLGIVEGSTLCFYVDGKEIYRGNIVDVSKASNSNTTKITAKDIGYTLANAKYSKNYVNMTAEKVADEMTKLSRLKVGKFIGTNIKLTRYFRDVSAYEIIMTMYTLAAKTTKKKYMLDIDLDKVNIIERGLALTIAFDEDSNIYSVEHTSSVENLINQVTVVDKDGNKISENVNKDLLKVFNRMKNAVLEVEDKSKVNKAMIDELYHGVDYTSKLEGYGNYTCKSGMKVHVSDKHTGLIGEFYIDSDTHEWIGGNYKCSLDLNFKNIMDDKDAGSDTLDKNNDEGGTTTGTKDWGHGVTAEMLNKVLRGPLAGKGDLFVKYGNMYKVNPMLMLMISRMETGAGFNSNLARNCNNFFGIRDPDPNIRKTSGGFGIYSSIEEGIKRGFHFIGISHIHKKNRSYDQIISTWAPKSDGNNVAAYIANTKKWYKEWTGTDWNDSKRGSGVASDAEAEKNVVITGSNGTGTIEGVNGYKFVNQKQKIIVEEALKMVGKGRYTYAGSRSNIYATDCSGFIHILHKKAGIRIGEGTGSQLSAGRGVSLSKAMAGDIIVMDSKYSPSGRHVVLCVGNGKIVHNGGPKGAHISMRSIYTYGKYYVRRCWE